MTNAKRGATLYQTVEGLKCYQQMGQLDREFTCRMELCPYWSEDDDTGTSLCNVPQIIADARALLEAGAERAQGQWLRVPDYPGEENNPGWDCTECGAMCAKQHNFCPACGAQMQRQEETTDTNHEGGQKNMANRHTIIEAIKNSGKVRTAQWGEPDEWDQCTCTRCGYDCGYDNDRFCAKCGSYMTNYQPDILNHYHCKWCGASLDGVGSITVISPDPEKNQPQTFTFECPTCGRKSLHTFADAEVETLDDGYDAEFASEMGIDIPSCGPDYCDIE